MRLLRLLVVFALMPATAWSGLPHVACRCSDGEVHFFCPRLSQAKTTTPDSASSATNCNSSKGTAHKACCGGSQAVACHDESSNGSSHRDDGCCAAGCRCTPVFLQAEIGQSLKKVCVPEQTQIDLAVIQPLMNRVDQVAFADQTMFDTGPRIPIDIVVLYERFLI